MIMCTCVCMHECYCTACVPSPSNCLETSKGCVSEVLVKGSLLLEVLRPPRVSINCSGVGPDWVSNREEGEGVTDLS